MAKRSAILFYFFNSLLTHFLTLSSAEQNFIKYSCARDAGYKSTGSPYNRNVNAMLSSILFNNNKKNYGFYNMSFGQEPERVNAIALCRGDISLHRCVGCVGRATQKILKVCPNHTEAIGWYPRCMLRYSNRYILGVKETQPVYYFSSKRRITGNVNRFRRELQELLTNLKGRAASGDCRRKFATGNVTVNFQPIYALVQCTPDLTEQDCSDCLDDAIKQIPRCCEGRQGGRVLNPSCNLRFDNRSFLEPAPDLPQLPPSAPPLVPTSVSGENGVNAVGTVIIIVSINIAALLTIVGVSFFFRWRKSKENIEPVDETSRAESLLFDFNTIRIATNNFSAANRLGQGGFGAVYKGTLPNGQDVAVKRLSRESGQGDIEFKNEVLLEAELEHRNLVCLLGFCLEGNERLLIYEFVPNISLDRFLFDPMNCIKLNWEARYTIIRGIARGLFYLHEDSQQRIIHLHLKASNILLDTEMNPKISNSRMVRFFKMDEADIRNKMVGNHRYIAPEYAMHGQFSEKSDVFSFGVLVLEILIGQRGSFFRNGDKVKDLISFAWKNWNKGTTLNIIDPTLRVDSRIGEITRCIHIGLLCVQENVVNRPTMASVIVMLDNSFLTLPIPSEPAFIMHDTSSDVSPPIVHDSGAIESNHSGPQSLLLSASEAPITTMDPR